MKTLKPLVALLVIAAAGCGKENRAGGLVQDTTSRDLSLAPVDSSAPLNDLPAESPATVPTSTPPPPPSASRPARPAATPAPPPPPPSADPSPDPAPAPAPAPSPAGPATRSVEAGTTISLTAVAAFSTKTHKVGQTVTANVASDIKDDNGKVVIPAGATVTLAIVELTVSENKSDPGKVALRATQVSFGGQSYDLDGASTEVEHELKGRGVQAGDAAKVGAGAVAGAVLGRVISGKKKGAVVGGVVGAAAGTAVAANSADRDVVVSAGAKIVIALKSLFSLKA